MSDLRFDPVTGIWVAIARNRLDRPMEYVPIEQIRQQLICPFCGGNEEHTPDQHDVFDERGRSIAASESMSNWTVRSVPNKYPSFHDGANQPPQQDVGPYGWTGTIGHQELIIPSPRHITSLSELNDAELNATFRVFQSRLCAVQQLPQIRHTMLFMNCRSAAGASIGHLHFQLIGSPIVSQHLQLRSQRNIESVENFGATVLGRIIEWERKQQTRVVQETENFLVVCPFASRFAFQVWIVPKDPGIAFVDLQDAARNELAAISRSLVQSLDHQLTNPAYNLLLHHTPSDMTPNDHWYLELFPRLTQGAGFELGTNVWVNPIPPETAAARLQS